MKQLKNSYPLVLTLTLAILLLISCSQTTPLTTNAGTDTPTEQANQITIDPAKQVSNTDNQSAKPPSEQRLSNAAQILEQADNLPELAEIPDTITIADQQLSLDIFLWRDFQPISFSESNGQPMLALVKLIDPTTNKAIALKDLTATKLWVFNGVNNSDGEIWATQLEQQLPSEYMARQGPKWEPDAEVNVVVEVIDGEENIYFLKAEQQVIQRTD